MKKTRQHKWDSETRICKECGVSQDDELEAPYDCADDLSMWCAPGQSVQEMLRLAAERDKD